MSNNYWIKLYHEILHDPKMGRLPDNVWRRCIELFLMAGETQQDGRLPTFDDICWQFRHIPCEQIKDEIEQLKAVGILSEDEAGLYITKFSDRQAKIPNAEKQRAYRDRKRSDVAAGYANGYGDVTEHNNECYRSVTNGNAEEETETDINSSSSPSPKNSKSSAALTALTSNYTDLISTALNPILADEFNEYAAKVEPPWVFNAYKIAAKNDALTWPYVRAILDTCIDAGRWVDKQRYKNGHANKSSPPEQTHSQIPKTGFVPDMSFEL